MCRDTLIGCIPPAGDLACNPGVCPDWELNRPPLGSQVGAQSTEPHQPGPERHFEDENDRVGDTI